MLDILLSQDNGLTALSAIPIILIFIHIYINCSDQLLRKFLTTTALVSFVIISVLGLLVANGPGFALRKYHATVAEGIIGIGLILLVLCLLGLRWLNKNKKS